mmetsp:Transcript_11712/g.24815  ORF Transcript_11712/g.24815 Transcript_11712/m.24815 type:complete len:170 (+) Transcript_11712:279-788(+)
MLSSSIMRTVSDTLPMPLSLPLVDLLSSNADEAQRAAVKDLCRSTAAGLTLPFLSFPPIENDEERDTIADDLDDEDGPTNPAMEPETTTALTHDHVTLRVAENPSVVLEDIVLSDRDTTDWESDEDVASISARAAFNKLSWIQMFMVVEVSDELIAYSFGLVCCGAIGS